jgi:hypothetical protein
MLTGLNPLFPAPAQIARKGLTAHVLNHFGKKIPEEKIQAFIDELVADKQLSETKDAITYHF